MAQMEGAQCCADPLLGLQTITHLTSPVIPTSIHTVTYPWKTLLADRRWGQKHEAKTSFN